MSYEVEFTAWAHGAYTPERPWKVVSVSKPGTPGDPANGRRYMTSYDTRERAIQEAAKQNAFGTKRYQTALKRAQLILEDQTALEIAKLESSTRVDDGSRPPA
jgi:hypothetical protein